MFALFLICIVMFSSVGSMAINYDDKSQIDNYYSHKQNVDTSSSTDFEPSASS